MDPVTIGLAAAPFIAGLFAKKPKPIDVEPYINQWRGEQPTGYLTADDEQFGQRELGRASENIGYGLGDARSEAIRRYRARGLYGSPAMERSLGRLERGGAVARAGAAGRTTDMLYNLRLGREAYQRQQGLLAFQTRVGNAYQNQHRRDLQNSEFWNSSLGYLKDIAPYFMGGGSTAQVGTTDPTSQHDLIPGSERPS